MFWDFFFYSFVYDTSLEMCLNGNVLLWNLRDACFLVIPLFFCGFICWVVLLHLLGWVHLPWRTVVGGIMPNPGQGWDWSLLGDKCLKSLFKRISPLKPCTSYSHQIPQIYVPESMIQEAQTHPLKYCIWSCGLWWSCVTPTYFLLFFSHLSSLVKVDLSWNLHLTDGVPPQCAQTRTLVHCCRCMGNVATPC